MSEIQLWQLAVVLLGAKFAGEFCERLLKQPAVLGELVIGILLGGSVFHLVNAGDAVMGGLAGIGAIFLLFEVGLECDLKDLFKVGKEALFVATIGVILPMVMGYFVGVALNLSTMQALFAGAALTATSVGITARVFGDLHFLKKRESNIVLGAAVADDVLGLVILAAVSGIATTRSLGMRGIAIQALLADAFLVGAIVLGMWATPHILRVAGTMRTRAAVSTAAIIFCLLLASLSQAVKLAPIVGAFAAGLVLNRAEHKVHFEDKVKSIADMFIPVFFVLMGANIDVTTMNPATAAGRATLLMGAMLSVVAIIGKVLAGVLVPGRGISRLIVGVGMIPRGEVGLIFAGIGLANKIIPPTLYSAIIMVVVVTTFVTPPLLKHLIKPAGPRKVTKKETELAEADKPMLNAG